MKKLSFTMISRKGFALPSVLIASVVMLAVLMAAFTATAASRAALDSQYYDQLARLAAESGAAQASSCLQEKVTWTTELRPNTNCAGVATPATCPTTLRDARCGVIDNRQLRTTFAVAPPVTAASETTVLITGEVLRLRTSNGQEWRRHSYTMRMTISQLDDIAANRASQRYWYFGNKALLDFGVAGTNLTPKLNVMPGCVAATCLASEGVTVVNNKGGELIFWTNGRSIWNRDGGVMSGGTGLNASDSATQAAVSFPLGQDGTKYAVVSNNAEAGVKNWGELYYSVIDMTLDGGRGAVTQKNIALAGDATKDYSTEALSAAPKADGSGYWVSTFKPGTAQVYTFEFDRNQLVSQTPKITNLGSAIVPWTPTSSGPGTMNFTKDYKQLILHSANYCPSAVPANCPNGTGTLRLLDFNPTTGTFSNERSWASGTSQMTAYASFTNAGYAADFSPGEKYIYMTTIYPGRMYRYSLADTTSGFVIKNSEEFVAITNSLSSPTVYQGSGQAKAGPDGKMYVANYGAPAISVLQTPDEPKQAGKTVAESVGWRYNGQPLVAGSSSTYGLPQMVTSYIPRIVLY